MYYATFFQLKESPFSIAPNPHYLFMSERHREALAHLVYGVTQGNGFVALTGEVGTGKTTLCNCLLDQLPEHIDLALVLNPRLNAEELLATICDELGVSYPKRSGSLKVLTDALTKHLLDVHSRGRNTVLLIDEAQNLSIDVLEQIRLLSNLETNDTKLLQIVLVGQPELNHLLAQDRLRQLNQRITARYHIEALSHSECAAYIDHRLQVAGAGSNIVFSKAAIRKVFHYSKGVPRLINIICERALLGAYSLGKKEVGPSIIRKAAREVLLPSSIRLMLNWRVAGAFGIGLISAVIVISALLNQRYGNINESAQAARSSNTVQNNSQSDAVLEPNLIGGLFPDLVKLPQFGNQNGSASGDPIEKSGGDPIQTTGGNRKETIAGDQTQSSDTTQTNNKADGDQSKATAGDPIEAVASVPIQSAGGDQAEIATEKKLDLVKTNTDGNYEPQNQSKPQPPTKKPRPSDIQFSRTLENPELDFASALPQLFHRWKITKSFKSRKFCRMASEVRLQCFESKGRWNYLLKLNRPAILEFTVGYGTPRFVTLVAIDKDRAIISFPNDDLISFPISEIFPYWQGKFAMLWDPPAQDAYIFARGSASKAVVWIRKTLAVINGRLGPVSKSLLFDRKLEAEVIAFQTENGLKADGIVGAETMILLNNYYNSKETPKLIDKAD